MQGTHLDDGPRTAPGKSGGALHLAGYGANGDAGATRRRQADGLHREPTLYRAGSAALAADPNVLEKSGKIWNTRQLAHLYHFSDSDGTLPLLKKQWMPE